MIGRGILYFVTNRQRRANVLIEDPVKVARKLKAAPGQWFLIGVGEPDETHTLEQVGRVLAQTAYRIRLNHRPGPDGKRKGLRAFAATSEGYFEATSTADQARPDQAAPVELSARWVLGAQPDHEG